MACPRVWERCPEHDKRIARGDDYAGDAWRHTGTGDIRWIAVGHSIDKPCALGSGPAPAD